MISKYNLATISPDFDGSVWDDGCGGTNILFDWTEMQIPNGACVIKSVSGTIMGTNGTAANGVDIRLYFAKSINGVAPAAFGTAHADISVNAAASFRKNILGSLLIDMSAIDDADKLVAYNVISSKLAQASSTAGELRSDIMLEGEPNITTKGYTSIYVAAMANGAAFDFGTDVDLNMAGHQATSVAPVQITVSGTDPRLVFQAGDIIVGDAGNSAQAEIVSIDSNVLMTVKNITSTNDQITHTEHLTNKNPITLNFGLEY